MAEVTDPVRRVSPWRRRMRWIIVVVLAALLVVSGPWLWTKFAALGHVSDVADAPTADVVIVLGTAVAADRRTPEARLKGRLEAAAELVKSGRSRVILVSGDGGGQSGDEPAVMTNYLTERLGIDPRRVVADPSGLDTYDTCARARDVYGVTRALIVTQAYHLSRAVALCRHLGVDVDGVIARCDECDAPTMAQHYVRDYFASGKAAWDALRRRPPAVISPKNPGISNALQD